MTHLKDLKLTDFVAHIGEIFMIKLIDDNQQIIEYPLTLISAQPIVTQSHNNRQSFSLTLQHERTDIYLQQGTYPLEHSALGVLHLFIVPLGPHSTGMQYEVIFN